MKNPAVIFDNGSGIFKGGLAEDDTPRIQFQTIVGVPKKDSLMIGMDQKEFYIGSETTEKKTMLDLYYPIESGVINNWDQMEQIWSYAYETELAVDPSEHAALVTEPPLNNKANREKIIELFFEKFQVDSFYLAISSVLSLYSSGKTTGLVVDLGYGDSFTVPIYEGFALPYGVSRLSIGGNKLTKSLLNMLNEEKRTSLDSLLDYEYIEEIKKNHCFIAQDYDAVYKEYQDSEANKISITLPDGQKVNFGNLGFKCTEALLQPTKLGIEENGIHECAYQSILRCEGSIRKELYANIVFSGGTSMLNGVSKRVSKEISALAPSTMTIKVKTPQERKHSSWIGGSILSSIDSFSSVWITAKEYKEKGGGQIIHKRCF